MIRKRAALDRTWEKTVENATPRMRGTGVSAGAEKSREVVVQEGKQESCQNDVQIAHGFRGGLFRDSLGQQDGTAEEESCCGEEQRDPGAAEQRSGVGPAELFTVPGAEGAACQDADADASAEDQGVEHIHQGSRYADAG